MGAHKVQKIVDNKGSTFSNFEKLNNLNARKDDKWIDIFQNYVVFSKKTRVFDVCFKEIM